MQAANELQCLTNLSALISERTGLVFKDQDLSILRSKLMPVLSVLNEKSFESLHNRLERNQNTLPEELISALTIGETYFFRCAEQMDTVIRHILPALRNRLSSRHQLKIWSAGCATGEEPYTLAMILANFAQGLWPDRVNILATDINHTFLAKAAKGEFGPRSVRSGLPEWAQHFFIHRNNGGYWMPDTLSRGITFAHHNLIMDPPRALAGANTFMIVCRNVFIYFDEATQSRILDGFARVLEPDGFLILGPSESLLHHNAFRTRVMEEGCIIYQLRSSVSSIPAPRYVARTSMPSWKPAAPTHLPEHTDEVPAVRHRPTAISPDDRTNPVTDLKNVCEAMNRDDLEGALNQLQKINRNDPLHTGAWLIRAQLHEQRGEFTEALEALRKIRYLVPDLIVGHFLSATIAHRINRLDDAIKHYNTVLSLLSTLDNQAQIPECYGMTRALLQKTVELALSQITVTH